MKHAATAVAVVVPIMLAAMVATRAMQPPPPQDPECQGGGVPLCIDEVTGQVREETTAQADSAAPLRSGTQFRVNCPQVDGGTVADLLVPMDGGIAGARVRTDSIYVAPVSGTTQLRVGFGSTLTPSKGFELGLAGSSARDGVGVTLDLTEASLPTCVSEGNAQQVDVITGRQ